MDDYYQILGVPQDATVDQIKAVYRKLAHIYHPDETVLDKKHATEKFKELNEAYAILSDPIKRAKYDAGYAPKRGGAAGAGARPAPPRPAVSPDPLDFGSLRPGDKRTARFKVTNLGGPVTREINFEYSPNTDPWFQFALLSKRLPLEVEVSVDTEHLSAGRSYSGWIEVSLDGVTARVTLALSVLATATGSRASKATTASTVACPNCGYANSPDEIYCQRCAYPLGGKRDCPHCKRVMPVHARYCPACRRKA